jgi:eukaryotic-like serine/threonine-protein kinase
MLEQSSFNKLVGTTLGNYRLQQLIGRDSIGPIFIAHTATTNGPFLLRALVVPTLEPEARVVALGRFQQEANQVATLQHPGILSLVDYGNHQGMPYLVWPHNASMKPLHAHITQNGPLDALTASRYLDQIAAALEYAHGQAVLHRNLTTHTIFMDVTTPPHVAKLVVTDFGVLRMLELVQPDKQQDASNLNNISEGCAPEQLLGQPLDAATDIYALGAILYRLLTGHRVYVGKTREEVTHAILHAPVPSLGAWRNDLPPGLDEIIAHAMAKEPAKRFRQPIELAHAYHELVAPRDTARPPLAVTAMPVAAAAAAPPARPVKASSSRVSRRRILYFAVTGSVAAAAITTVAIYGNHFLAGRTSSASVVGENTGGPGATSTTQTHIGTIIARASDVPANSAKTFAIANQSNPGILIHLANSNTFVAFDSTCTHAGCAVNYSSQDHLLKCPCHEATFDPANNANVIAGPAPTPLAAIHITLNADGTITSG